MFRFEQPSSGSVAFVLRTFNVNFNVNFNISLEYLIVHPLDKLKTSDFFQITNLMHNSFIFQQYVCYTTLLNISKEDVPTWCKQFYYDFIS